MDVITSIQSNLLPEFSVEEPRQSAIPFAWHKEEALVLETLQPVLDDEARETILSAAVEYWSRSDDKGPAGSRFTLQGANKREVHATDLGEPAVEAINKALASYVYPLLRQGFVDRIPSLNLQSWSLLPYDALVIEYDATSENLLPTEERPAQPLHRDLGLLSVNIALDDPSGFQGGGTVFERLLLDEDNSPTVVPRSAGHAVAHPCRERHAGGALISGKRTILVLFMTGTPNGRAYEGTCPKVEIAARCKAFGTRLGAGETVHLPTRRPLSGNKDQILTYRAALRSDPTDGEAWLYLAISLMRGPESRTNFEAIEALLEAKSLNPADGRVYNTLGIALERQAHMLSSDDFEMAILEAYRMAALLHRRAAGAGCKGAALDARSSLLNWGLWHANRDEFENAVAVLRQVFVDSTVAAEPTSKAQATCDEEIDARQIEANRVVRDARRLLSFCENQLYKVVST